MKTILIIDDEKEILSSFAVGLEACGYRVLATLSGDEGLAMARRELPDLILTDIKMPGTDGRSVLKALREDHALGATQIVLMTGVPEAVTLRAGMELGADDFLVKPFDLEDLVRCVEARLSRARVHWRVEDRILTELRSNLHATLPHEFFTPLAGVLGLVQVLRHDFTGLPAKEVDNLLEEIEQAGWKLHRTLKNYLSLVSMGAEDSSQSATVPVLSAETVADLVSSRVEAVLARNGRRPDLVSGMGRCSIRGDADAVASIVEELVENACAFSPPGTPIDVRLSADGALTVADKGRGMTAAQVRQISVFRQFDRRKYEQQGLGLGLVLVQRLAARCGARFSLESQPGRGTTATMAFQAAPPTDEKAVKPPRSTCG